MNNDRLPKSVAVIGGSGFLGRALVEKIAQIPSWSDCEVRVLDMAPYPDQAERPKRFRAEIGDAADPKALRDVIDGADAVFLRAGKVGGMASGDLSQTGQYLRANVETVAAVLDVCEQCGCRRLLFDSSEQVFGDPADQQSQDEQSEPRPSNLYGAAKQIAHKLIERWAFADTGRSAQIFRYPRVHGDLTRDVIYHMANAALSGKPIRIIGNAGHAVAFVHVDDVIAANLAALTESPKFRVLHIATDRLITLFDLAQRIREWAGSDSPITRTENEAIAAYEPFVVGMRWEESIRQLGLSRPIGLDRIIERTLDALKNLD